MSIIHPVALGDRVLWSEDGTTPGDLQNKLRFGDSVRGWEGDPALVLSYRADVDQWEVLRFGDDGTYRVVARKPPGVALDDRVIDELVQRDTQRGFDVGRYIEQANEGVRRAALDRQAEAIREDVGPRIEHHLRKES